MSQAIKAVAGVVLIGFGLATSWTGGAFVARIGWGLLLSAPAEAMAPPR